MQRRVPLRFFVVTFAWSWLIWAPLVLANLGIFSIDAEVRTTLAMPAAMLGAFGPAIGACCSVWTLDGRRALTGFAKSFLSPRFGWKAWVSIFAVPGTIGAVAWYVPELLGHDRLPMLLPSAFVFPIWLVLMALVGGGQEEVGWRGYIMEPLEARLGIWWGNIVLGTVWAVWHAPLWLVEGSSQVYVPFVAFLIGTIGMSFFFSWVVKTSGGRPLSAVIVHGAYNAFIALLPTLVMEPDVFQVRMWIQQPLLLVVGVVLMLRYSAGPGERQPTPPR